MDKFSSENVRRMLAYIEEEMKYVLDQDLYSRNEILTNSEHLTHSIYSIVGFEECIIFANNKEFGVFVNTPDGRKSFKQVIESLPYEFARVIVHFKGGLSEPIDIILRIKP